MIGASNRPLSTIPEFTLIRGLRVGPSITPGWGLVARGTNQVIRRVGVFTPTYRPPGREEGLEIESNHQ